jgi:dTDP-4-amino-4,6-dideoxygalactose transaminase
VDPETGNIDPASVAKLMRYGTRALMIVHYGGNLCDPVLAEMCRHRQVTLIEDCAHLNGPGLGGLQCYSFQAIKHLTTGDGGCLVTQDKKVYERAKLLRWYGIDREAGQSMRSADPVREAGYKFHMNDIAATIGLANFRELPTIVRKVNRHARYYDRAFERLRTIKPVPTPVRNDYWLYILLVEKKAGFAEHMKAHGIETSPVHSRNDTQPIFRSSKRKLPGLESFWKRQVCIPVGWWLTGKDAAFVADTVRRFDEVCSD